ncbi:MAG: 3-deoxy-manno-octulosonate cytidylyltransferase synthetase [Candidatus Sumerlaeota bacterium]|nr:3-deoxy-manno-octulosonate cytidylyltransferase synthetase [Candidatus Sumerlaeota bacterium]
MSQPYVVAVIPSRYGAQRLPGKPLVKLLGKPMVQWVYEAAKRAEGIAEVLVATDDERIREAVEAFGGTAVMTPHECPSGTDRIQAAMQGRKGDIVVNVQGDEPGMAAASIQTALEALLNRSDADVSTGCIPITRREDFEADHIVKVVRGADSRALYFSREPIPSHRRVEESVWNTPGYVWGYKHLGLYVYRRESLEAFVRLEQGHLELLEKLEQLRFLEVGATILCPEVKHDSIGVDVQADVAKAEELLRKLHGL